MKKVILVVLCLMALSVWAAAQSFTGAPGSVTPLVDVLGAHNNGGRGCAGCHAPHSGWRGGGGNVATGTGSSTQDTANAGNDALWGQDLGPLYGYTLNMGDGGRFVETLPASTAFAVGDEEIRGIMMCLSCHDGNIAQGAMMTNQSYEQKAGLLPAGLYGNTPIPTLLGNDGTAAGNYNNDHPVGQQATLAAAHLISSATDTSNLVVEWSGSSVSSMYPPAGSKYANFVADYGMPALEGTAYGYGVANPTGNTDPSKLYVVCTTCHNQHVMNVYKSVVKKAGSGNVAINGIANDGGGKTYGTYFFINAPYNPGATRAANQASSTAQFCRQCHFGTANESMGVAQGVITTAF